jgi:hypothetical protein
MLLYKKNSTIIRLASGPSGSVYLRTIKHIIEVRVIGRKSGKGKSGKGRERVGREGKEWEGKGKSGRDREEKR